MIQDINPSKLYNQYKNDTPVDGDYVLVFNEEGKLLLNKSDNTFTRLENVKADKYTYLLSVDEEKYFLAENAEVDGIDNYEYLSIVEIRDMMGGKELYGAFSAYHLWRWYSDNKMCGRCGSKLVHSDNERALRCPDCGNMVFPRINPAVIVGVTKGDEILLTRYRTGYKYNALVAGFTEFGETLEETVAREVMEETGVNVKNIRYYKSQPWGMAQDILMGFYCDVDGDATIKMDADELKYAEWVKREDIELQPNNLSLTNEMMNEFKCGRQ